MNRSPNPLCIYASEDAVRWSIEGPTRVSTRDTVAFKLSQIEGSDSPEVWMSGEWVNESDLDALWSAMQRLQHVTREAHVFEYDGDVIRCAACHHLPAHCQGAAS